MGTIRQPFRYSNDGAVYWLIGINVLVYFAMYFLRFGYLKSFLAMNPEKVLQGRIWTFVTYMFVHDGFTHILFNMIALFFFGIHVERQMGSKEFLLFYFVTGSLAGVFSFFVYCLNGQLWISLIGASGAVFAVELAYAVFFPTSVILLWGIIPLRAPVLVLGFTALELFSSIFRQNSGVAHLTHLAGFAFAWLYFVIRFGINPWNRLRSR
jgi:membrane associated rhomboid family serine protease